MQKKKGISLIVLVITIIVMIILAAAVVISLSNSGIINRADHAVNLTNEQQVQDLAALVWADAYMEGLRGTVLVDTVKNNLKEQGVTEDKWYINVTDTGVTVTSKNSSASKPGTLGYLITGAADYGKTVDYSANGATGWKVFYETEDYVFLISETGINVGTALGTVSSLTTEQLELYKIFKLGQDGYELDLSKVGNQAVAKLIADYNAYANTTDYGSNVVGAMGTATLELFVASYNARGYTPTLTITTDENGYKINESGILVNVPPYGGLSWLAAPIGETSLNVYTGGSIMVCPYSNDPDVSASGSSYIYPVVCLKSSTPAEAGTTTDFSLVK